MPTNEQRREAAKRKLERQLARRAERVKRRRRYTTVGSAVAVVLVVGLVVLINLLGDGGESETAAELSPAAVPSSPASTPVEIPTDIAPPPTRAQALPATVDCQYPSSNQTPAREVQSPPPGPTSTVGTVPVTINTSEGVVPATLDRAIAPCTVASFVSLAQQDYYNDTPCHRLTTGPGLGMLQCGDPTGQGTGGPGYTIPDELVPGTVYGRGYLAMAKAIQPNSGGSQFFIVYGYAAALNANPTYTVFGTVSADGLSVIDDIARAGDDGSFSTTSGGGKPNKPVTIRSVEVGG